jgi:8-oxo-dGTP pyrophosphatase MutT (NUDIX family)
MSGGAGSSLLDQTRAAVEAFQPATEEEEGWRRVFLDHLDRLPRPFDRDADLTHVTASAVVVSPGGVLLHRHRLLGIWLQPGGHLDAGEAPWDAAVREVIEETGISARHATEPSNLGHPLLHLHVGPGGRGHTHLDLRYLLVADEIRPAPPPGESQDVAWFDWDEALAVADPALIGALRAARSRR